MDQQFCMNRNPYPDVKTEMNYPDMRPPDPSAANVSNMEGNGIYPVHVVANLASPCLTSPQKVSNSCLAYDGSSSRNWMEGERSQTHFDTNLPVTVTTPTIMPSSFFIPRQQPFTSNRTEPPFVEMTNKGLTDTFVLKRYKCSLCIYRTSYKSDLNRHMKKHSKCPYSCDICKMPFMSMGIVMYHKRKHHPDQVPTDTPKYQCSVCPYGTKYKSDLNRHLKQHTLAKFFCDMCKLPFLSKETLNLHRRTWHSASSGSHEIPGNDVTVGFPDSSSHPFVDNTVSFDVPPFVGPEMSPNPVSANHNEFPIIAEKMTSYLESSESKSNRDNPSTPHAVECSVVEQNDELKLETKKGRCEMCLKDFSSQSVLEFHIRNTHAQLSEIPATQSIKQDAVDAEPRISSPELSLQTVQCHMCVYQTCNKSDLDQHISKHKASRYSCSICKMPFKNCGNLTQHKRLRHQMKPVVPPGGYKYKCSMCIYHTDHKTTMNRHTGKHAVSKFNCELCNMPFMNQGNVILHKKIHHPGELSDMERNALSQFTAHKFQCPHCAYGSSYKATINRHIKKHSIARYHCDICKMPFINPGNVFHHKKMHHPELVKNPMDLEEKYKCSLCSYSSRYKTNIDRHIKTHGTAKYHCEVCNMPFVFGGSLLSHKRFKHKIFDAEVIASTPDNEEGRNEMKHCPFCSLRTSNLDKLNKHIKKHKISGYYCGSCCITFTYRDKFEKHMQEHYENGNSLLGVCPSTEGTVMPYGTGTCSMATCTRVNESDNVALRNASNTDKLSLADVDAIKGKIHVKNSSPVSVSDEDDSSVVELPETMNSLATEQHSCVDKEVQCNVSPAVGMPGRLLCHQNVSSEVFSTPPRKGRYAKLVSDFDEFAERPFACALCYHRYSVFEDLATHIQNHLTGAGYGDVPQTARFNNLLAINSSIPSPRTTDTSIVQSPDNSTAHLLSDVAGTANRSCS